MSWKQSSCLVWLKVAHALTQCKKSRQILPINHSNATILFKGLKKENWTTGCGRKMELIAILEALLSKTRQGTFSNSYVAGTDLAHKPQIVFYLDSSYLLGMHTAPLQVISPGIS